MAMIAGERAGRGVRAPMLPTPAAPSYRGAACTAPGAAKDWRTEDLDKPDHQRFLANKYCDVCPIAEMCLEGAITRGETAGVWGGLVAEELERAREIAHPKKSRKNSAKKPTPVPAAAEAAPVLLGVAA